MSICVHGLGYVGLATAALFANDGRDVTGFDIDERVVERLRDGGPNLGEPELEGFVTESLNGNLAVQSEPVPADVHLICAPTPYDHEQEEAVLTYVRQAGKNTAEILRPGDTVVLESTVPPGTTTGMFSRAVSECGMVAGSDFKLGYTPETVLPGNTVTELRKNDRIVGGVNAASTRAIVDLYASVTSGTIHEAPDPTTAEFVKLAQNAARDVEIAYANTLALLARDYGVDVRQAIRLANNHPRVDILNPGPGVGGHCLPVDPLFFRRWSDETDLLDCARATNDRMPAYVVSRLGNIMGSLDWKTIAVLGVAYKGDVGDTRNSPGLEMARLLNGTTTEPPSIADGGTSEIEVRIHDPNVTDSTLNLSSLRGAVTGADAIVVAADHSEFSRIDPGEVAGWMSGQVVFDAVDVLKTERWEEQGFDVFNL